ncbi:type 1 glutamine amidotransferase [Paenibacillus thalictri]|uniref:GMP synthase n=1 Tax=Paenibacillus thalictri TaxID=2527873 RepID=A0A4Q9DI22_9BACL|nr:type 1 glutamine amidotransferase [Paenibacillus thalictri]TBL72708.1 GMP synthase [Paenibacillus thalictri]
MRVLLLRHFRFDDTSAIISWIRKNHYIETMLHPAEDDPLPELDTLDMLIVLGGPMSAYDEAGHPWLREEKQFIKAAVEAGKKVLGICLGAQLMAEALGGKVYRNTQKEIGWHPVHRTEAEHPLFDGIPVQFHSFQWHGDCFDLPPDALPLAYSAACQTQAFAYGKHALGLQFHLETTPACMETMLEKWTAELVDAPYIQKAGQILAQASRSEESHRMLSGILDRFI